MVKSPKQLLHRFGVLGQVIKTYKSWPIWLLNHYRLTEQGREYSFKIRAGSVLFFNDLGHFNAADEIWRNQIYTKYHPIKENSIVIDIGANVGSFSVFAARSAKNVKVFSFEPEPNNFALLQKNIEANRLMPNVKICNLAVAADDDGRVLFLGRKSGHHSTTPWPGSTTIDINTSKSVQVLSTTLENIFNENRLSKCDFLKMDCEGGEYEILFATKPEYLKKIKYLSLEYHHGPKEIEELLSRLGFLVRLGSSYDGQMGILYAKKIE